MAGHVKLYRSINDNPLWLLERFTKAQAWVDLFMNANWKPGVIDVRGNLVHIGRGQIGWSELTMAKRWKWSNGKVRRFLSYLEKTGNIVQQKTHITTIITICNYERYQSGDTIGGTTDGITDGQQTDNRRYTIEEGKEREEGKEGKNDEGESVCVEENPSITAEDIYAAYPKKVDKGHAIPAIKKAMKKVQPAELLRCVQAYSGSVKGKTERKFIPNPSTWFNGERWADDDAKLIADRDLSTMPWDELVVLYKRHRPANCPTTNGLSMPREQIEERLAKILTEKGI